MRIRYRKNRRRWPLYVLAVLCMALTVPSAYRVFQEQAQRGEAAKLAGLVSESIVQADPQQIPDYSGEDVIVLNGNSPSFTAEDLAGFTGEYYSSLDILGRCGTAAALLHRPRQHPQLMQHRMQLLLIHLVVITEQIVDHVLFGDVIG